MLHTIYSNISLGGPCRVFFRGIEPNQTKNNIPPDDKTTRHSYSNNSRNIRHDATRSTSTFTFTSHLNVKGGSWEIGTQEIPEIWIISRSSSAVPTLRESAKGSCVASECSDWGIRYSYIITDCLLRPPGLRVVDQGSSHRDRP